MIARWNHHYLRRVVRLQLLRRKRLNHGAGVQIGGPFAEYKQADGQFGTDGMPNPQPMSEDLREAIEPVGSAVLIERLETWKVLPIVEPRTPTRIVHTDEHFKASGELDQMLSSSLGQRHGVSWIQQQVHRDAQTSLIQTNTPLVFVPISKQ